MIESEFVQIVSTVGFPIAVSLWFMLRTEKVINNNTAMLEQVKVVIGGCTQKKP